MNERIGRLARDLQRLCRLQEEVDNDVDYQEFQRMIDNSKKELEEAIEEKVDKERRQE